METPHADSDGSRLIRELAHLTALDAPTGFEEPVLQYVRDELTVCCDNVECDIRGNVYGFQAGDSPAAPQVMLTAHADEIGFMITSVLADGHLRFTKLGQPTDQVLPGQRVRVLTHAEVLEGVIGVKPGHVLTAEAARQVPPLSELYIDVGATSAEEVRNWGIEPGTPAVFVGPLMATRNSQRFFGKAVDNRMGVLAVLECARRLRSRPVRANRAFVIVVEEEIGLRGAAVAAAHVQPDVVLAIDTVPAGGTPDLRPEELPWSIGKGPLIKVRETRGLSTHRPLRELIRQIAGTHEIPYQLIVDTAGITDGTSAQQAGSQIAAAVLGLARKYSHSAVEMFDLTDLCGLIDLSVHTVEALTDKTLLRRL